MLVLLVLACHDTPATPKWLSSCSTTAPDVTCVNADSVTRTKTDEGEDQIICHWDCVEIGGDHGGPDSSPLAEPFTTGLDLVFQLQERSVDGGDSSVADAPVYSCYEQVQAHRFDDRCP
jgi:hypothetical protein